MVATGVSLWNLFTGQFPEACLMDSSLYELLVIADTLRMGRVREMEIAINELKIRLDDYAKS